MAKIKKYADKKEKITSAWNDKGDKRYGFVSKDRVPDERIPDTRWKTRYGAGIDNLPLRGDSYNEINTPFGTLDYGNEGDTGFAGFTPNFERTSNYRTGDNGSWHQDYATIGGDERMLRAGSWGDPNDPTYFAGAFLGGDRNVIPDFDRSFNTPFGNLELSRNTEAPNSVFADFNPNDRSYYIQALANLLRGR